jgi:hypothetical protein
MKRRYQIDQQRAVQEFRQLAHDQNPNLQMIFPMTEVVGLLQEGVGHLMREAGLALMSLVMDEEVRHLAARVSETCSLLRFYSQCTARCNCRYQKAISLTWKARVSFVAPEESQSSGTQAMIWVLPRDEHEIRNCPDVGAQLRESAAGATRCRRL